MSETATTPRARCKQRWLVASAAATTATVAATIVSAALIVGSGDGGGTPARHIAPGAPPGAGTGSAVPVAAPPISAAQLAALPEATTFTALPAAPPDADHDDRTAGGVVHNTAVAAVFDAPGGTPFARLPVRQLGADTWLPIIAEQPGWLHVLLPSRPNGASGWLATAGNTVARSPYTIEVRLAARQVELYRDGQRVGTWPVGVGAPETPPPTGRTFLLAAVHDPGQPYSPVLLPLGAHSDVLETFDGGTGTVAIHTWPDPAVLGTASSHGCLRVPDAALRELLAVPLGTLVAISA